MKAALLLTLITAIAAQTLTITGTVRDFTPQTNPDFEHDGCSVEPGLVQSTLGADDKPVFSRSGCSITSQATFDQWYNDVAGVNIAIPISITLTLDPNTGLYYYDNQDFFPIDNQGFGNYAYGHNFGFTTEFATQFTYQGGETFIFNGDDDVYVFINRQLAIDLGGIHSRAGAAVGLDSLGLTVGQTYPLHIFQAERHTVGSNFGITTSLVIRTSVCGNGIVESSEECDGQDCCTSTCTFADRGTICRPAANACDITEMCAGATDSCPADEVSQTTSCFCARQNLGDGEMGYYCNANGGFYQCLGGVFAPQSRDMPCAAGTHCGCSFGTECSCELAKSPCVFTSDVQQC